MSTRFFVSRLLLAVLAAGLAGCSHVMQARLAYEGDARPPEQTAAVTDDGVIRFVAVNGKPLADYRRLGPEVPAGGSLLIEVLPGPNAFELCFSYATPAASPGPAGAYQPDYAYGANPSYGGAPAYNTGFCRETVTVMLDAQRGRIYQARFRVQRGNRWGADFVDVTDARGADIAERRRELARYQPER
ncbi:MAG TPA: hypothetical protein VLW45_06670 [Pelomicrobium sp.]|nr:hypothetical protein [Pelomicrobium sp.]